MIALKRVIIETQLTKRCFFLLFFCCCCCFCQKSNILHLEQLFGVKGVVHMLYYFCQLVHKKGTLF